MQKIICIRGKGILKKLAKIKIIEKLEVSAITQTNIDTQHVVFII